MATERIPRFPKRTTPPGPIEVAVVNDCPDTCQLWSHMLTHVFEDVTVHTQTNGVQFLQFVQSQPVHILFIDDVMPFMTGVETLEIIRTDGHPLSDIPIVMMTTGYGSRHEYLERGADEVMQLPFHVRETCFQLEMLMSRPAKFARRAG